MLGLPCPGEPSWLLGPTVRERWDPEEAFWRLDGPSRSSFDEEEKRRLFVMSSRATEVTRHRDIVTKDENDDHNHDRDDDEYTPDSRYTHAHERPRVFEDNGACGVDDDMPPCCNQTCYGLTHCTALNGRRIEDKYYPTLPFVQGSCDNLDDRASRLDIWGDYHSNKPFRDTKECRQLVLDYTCLWWATMFQVG